MPGPDDIPELISQKRFEIRRKLSKQAVRAFRKAARHLEKTGLSREASLIKAGEMFDMNVCAADVKVADLRPKRKAA